MDRQPGGAYRIRTGGLLVENQPSWAARRTRLVLPAGNDLMTDA